MTEDTKYNYSYLLRSLLSELLEVDRSAISASEPGIISDNYEIRVTLDSGTIIGIKASSGALDDGKPNVLLAIQKIKKLMAKYAEQKE